MLMKCPECELNVSDKALSCPHCGYPFRSEVVQKRKKRTNKNKRRRLPNGFGQISEIKNCNLRKPFRAMVTVGKTSTGKPICKLLKPEAFFETYNEAYEALFEYHKNPYDLEDDITVIQLYDRWSKSYFETLKSPSSTRTITAAWKHCTSVYDMRAKDIRARHIKGCMDSVDSANNKSRIKSMFNLMLDYAVEYEIVEKNYARTFNISDDIINEKESAKRSHISFSESELETLWKYKSNRTVRAVLIQCYSGWRPQELGLIKRENVDIRNWTFTGGMKTDAGTNRVVPICEKIKELVLDAYNEGYEYLLTDENGNLLTYDKLRHRFEAMVKEVHLNPEHRAHDGRKTFVTLCKKYNVDEYAIKYMVGHAISDLTEKVYTDRDSEWLKHEIAKLK